MGLDLSSFSVGLLFFFLGDGKWDCVGILSNMVVFNT